jgi:hypothetical protein
MSWIIALLVVVGIMTLVGHGIWVLLATICRALFFDLSPPPIRCRHCGRPAVTRDGRCRWCERPQVAAKEDEQTDLTAVTRQLRRWQSRGTLKPCTAERMLTRVDAYRRSLSEATNPPAPASWVEPVVAEIVEPIRGIGPHVGSVAVDRHCSAGGVTAFDAGGTPTPQGLQAGGTSAQQALQAAATSAATRQEASGTATRPSFKPDMTPPKSESKPRRSLGETLATFMEERNIRWGELAGGSLIVCSSVALVISLWEQLEAIPYFQFFIFVAVSAALFGIGLYTEHRWKLASTSRGVLMIATLLVPLNFVAMVATRKSGFDPLALLMELIALGVFATLVGRSGKVLVGPWSSWLNLAVIGNSGALLLLIHGASPAWAACVGAGATLINATAVGAVLRRASRERAWGDTIAARLFTLTGVASFALVVTLGMAAARSADRWFALHSLSPLLALAALPALACGLLVMTALSQNPERGGWRTAGTAVALLGATVILTAMALAWPLPGSMITVGLIDFAALAALAWRYRLPLLHAFAAVCLAIAYVVASHVFLGHIAFGSTHGLVNARLFLDGTTGVCLLGLSLLFAALTEALRRRSRIGDAVCYGAACVAVAAASLILVTWPVLASGGDQALRAALVWAAYGLAGLTAGAYLRSLINKAVVGAEPRHSADLALEACRGDAPVGAPHHRRVGPASGTSAGPPLTAENGGPALASSLVPPYINLTLRNYRLIRTIDIVSVAMLYIAALFGTTSWLLGRRWVGHDAWQLVSSISLQCYAAAWAAVSLMFVVLRVGLQRWLTSCSFTADIPAIDRVVLRITSAASLGLSCWQAWPGVFAEFTGSSLPTAPWAFDTCTGWSLWVIAVLGLAASLWDEWRDDDLVAAVLLSINAAVLAAIPFSTAWATASALRWALAGVFAVSATLVWFRSSLARACDRAGCRLRLTGTAAATARTLWLVATALPVVVGSALTAAMRMAGQPPAGPLSGSWFAGLGLEISHLAPLAIIVLGIVAYAVREMSPGYALGAGLIASLTVTGGYALMLRRLSAWDAVCLLQIATLTAAVWAAGWLAARRWVIARSGGGGASRLARPLLQLQLAQCGLGNLLLVVSAAAALFFASPVLPAALHGWVASVGSPLGWLTLAMASAAGLYRLRHFGERLRPELTGLLGLATLVLSAATIEWCLPGTPWPYRGLMLGWAMYALSVVAATWCAARLYAPAGAEGPPLALVRSAALWVRLAGLLAVALGLKTVMLAGIEQVEGLWAAGAIGIASAACAAMAVWLRREGWAFTAGLGVNLAASLAVCHRLALEHRPLGDEWVLLWQANVVAGAVVALIWLAARQRLYVDRELSSASSPLLSAQVAWLAAAALGLVVLPGLHILIWPNGDSLWLAPFAVSAGWFAWILPGVATAIYLHHAVRRSVDVLAVFLLGAGVLAAAHGANDAATSYATLTAVWLGAGIFLLAAGWLFDRYWVAGAEPGRPTLEPAAEPDGQAMPRFETPTHGSSPARAAMLWLRSALSKRGLEPWIAGIPLVIAGVGLRGSLFNPHWGHALGARVLAVALLPSVLAIWCGQRRYSYNGGLLVHLAASMFWYAQAEPLWIDLLLANALTAAATSSVWSLWTRIFGPLDTRDDEEAMPPLEHAALAIAGSLLALAGGWTWLAAAFSAPSPVDVRLMWLSVAAVAVAGGIALWDKRSAIARPALYVTGVAAVAFSLAGTGWHGEKLIWATAPALAGWLLTAAIIRSVPLPASLRGAAFPGRCLDQTACEDRLTAKSASDVYNWFAPVQAVCSMLAAMLAIWTCLHFTLPHERVAGPATSTLLLAATFLMARGTLTFWTTFWKVGSLSLLALLPAEIGWTWLTGDQIASLWIHRQVVLLSSVTFVIAAAEWSATPWLTFFRKAGLAARHGSPKTAWEGRPTTATAEGRSEATWSTAVRRFLPMAIATALVVLVALLVQEVAAMPDAASDGTRSGVAMAPLAKLAVVAVLGGLIGLALRYALNGERDPLVLSPAGRQVYVYAAELLGLATCLHFRITMPKLIPFGILENWWTLVVMIVAFSGVGLSELFKRRNLEVLSIPLRRTALAAPLLPVLALAIALVWRPSGDEELLFRARLVSDEAVFFLVALFYGLEAWLRRSLGIAVLSAVAGNAGVWLLWHRLHFDLLVHPQLWLIPPALAVLVAEYLNHARLSRQQSEALRYLALSVIYVSSTADVFISHVGHDISLPLVFVLLGLSVLGMLSGMLLRVRSFLYLGFTFLLIDLSIIVYHAAWDLRQTWVFWAANIAVGIAILAFFAFFEKRRNEAAKHAGGGQ